MRIIRRRKLLVYLVSVMLMTYVVLMINLPDLSIGALYSFTWETLQCGNVSDNSVNVIDDQRWITVGNIMYSTALYVSDIDDTYVKVMGIKDRKKPSGQVYCQMWYNRRHSGMYVTTAISVPASVRLMPEHRKRKYAGAFIECKLPNNEKPFALSLQTERCVQKPKDIIPVVTNDKETKKFTVCVTPLNFRYSRAYELVEMIEFNQILGADLFVFYNYSTHSNVDSVLKYYQDKGLVEVIQWHIPVKVDTWPKKQEPEIHYFGQLPALNDCLFRNVHRSRYVVYQDLDEFIIPRKAYTWMEMIKTFPSNSASYIFRNAFYRKDWPDNKLNFPNRDLALKYKAVTLLKSKRETEIQKKLRRSKYILNPRKVNAVGIHNIFRYKTKVDKPHFVEPEVALQHHYRDWENPKDTHKGIEDPNALRYSKDLTERLKNVWSQLSHVPMGPLNTSYLNVR